MELKLKSKFVDDIFLLNLGICRLLYLFCNNIKKSIISSSLALNSVVFTGSTGISLILLFVSYVLDLLFNELMELPRILVCSLSESLIISDKSLSFL